jgi:hypothetical protein
MDREERATKEQTEAFTLQLKDALRSKRRYEIVNDVEAEQPEQAPAKQEDE